MGSFFRGLVRFLKPLLYSWAKAVGKVVFKNRFQYNNRFLNKEPEQPVGNIFKNRFSEA